MIQDIQLPASLETEKTILSSILFNGDLIARAKDLMAPDVFYNTDMQRLYVGLIKMYEKDIPIDLSTVATTLPEHIEQIQELCNHASSHSIDYHAKELNDKLLRRKIILGISAVEKMAYNENATIENALDSIELLNSETEIAFNNAGIEIRHEVKIVTPEELYNETFDYKQHGELDSSFDCGFKNMTDYYRPAKGTLNVFNGIPSHGKSSFQDALMVNMAMIHDWHWLVFSPEYYPYKYFMQNLIEKHTGTPLRQLTDDRFMQSMAFIDRHFALIDVGDEIPNTRKIYKVIRDYSEKNHLDGVCIDPWNSLCIPLQGRENKTDAIGRELNIARSIARRRNLCFNIVAHPTKLQKDHKTGKYPVPTLYDLEGSAHWYNMAYNGLTVYRYFELDVIAVHIQKIKFKPHGKVGVVFLKYNRDNGRFEPYYGDPEMAEAMSQ